VIGYQTTEICCPVPYNSLLAAKFVGEDRMLNELFQIIEDRKDVE